MTTRRKSSKRTLKVGSFKHPTVKRKKLATEQTEAFMQDEDREPVKYRPPVRERRSIPVLSWDRKEKLEQLETHAHPLYVHEKIHPESWITTLVKGKAETPFQGKWEFNGFPKESAYRFYEHEGNWQNRIIQGDSVQIMASLAKKEGMMNKVQMIYYDPPYGIKFKSNMQRRTEKREADDRLPADPQMVQAFRDTWKNGMHSYFDAIYSTAAHARDLLSGSGSFFMQIGPENVDRCGVILDEVFGPDNRVERITFRKSGGTSARLLPGGCDYILWYAKDKDSIRYQQLYEHLPTRKDKLDHMSSYAMVELSDGETRGLTNEEMRDPDAELPPNARLYRRMSLTSQGVSTTGLSEPFNWDDHNWPCPPGRHWSVSMEGLRELASQNRLDAASKQANLAWKRYENEVPGRRITNMWAAQMSASNMHYIVETAESAIERCILMSTIPGDLVMDLTCGSGTTAYVAEKWGRRWITTDTSAIPIALTRQRIATAVYDWYLLQDSAEGALKEAQLQGRDFQATDSSEYGQDPSKGFVYERAPNVSAAILAYNQDVPPISLVNRPIKQLGIKRVSGPFTVESISPHRAISSESYRRTKSESDSENAILKSLESGGIRIGDDHIGVDGLEQWRNPKSSIRAIAQIESWGRTAVAVWGDERTAGDAQIQDAAKSAAVDQSIQKLLVIAFAYESDARGTRREALGRLEVIYALANRDLMIPDLANNDTTGIIAIGEPDIEIVKCGGGVIGSRCVDGCYTIR